VSEKNLAEKNAVLVSVILPVYNGAEHLAASIDSILAQTYTNIELLCIDDGSDDGSPEILAQYQAKDSRVTVLRQDNSGAGAARNLGLDQAKGQFLAFPDADDILEPELLARALDACQEQDADFCLFDSDQFSSNHRRGYRGGFKTKTTIDWGLLPAQPSFSWRDIRQDHFRAMVGWAWDKLFRSSFVRQNQLRFLEQHNSEDLFFVFTALAKASRIAVVKKCLYHQRVGRDGSLSRSRGEYPFDCYYSLLALATELRAAGLYDELERSFVNHALHYLIWNLATLPGQAFEQLYLLLKAEGFTALGITGRQSGYFYSPEDYDSYQKIIENQPIDFLQSELHRLRGQVDSLIQAIPLGLGQKAYAWYKSRGQQAREQQARGRPLPGQQAQQTAQPSPWQQAQQTAQQSQGQQLPGQQGQGQPQAQGQPEEPGQPEGRGE
jgi:glycosyltransferase involved in cell wall biosynthesis